MGPEHVKYLLAGGGLAAFSAAQAIRQRDPAGSLMLVGQEISRPYRRAPLSKSFLRRQASRASIFACDPNWFVEHHVQLHTGRRAVHLDTSRSVVTLDSGEAISYDRLLVATGATPRPLNVPGANLPNVFYLHGVEDVERLHTAIDKAKSEGRRHEKGRGRAAVVGGGLLGVEVAASLAYAGIAVDLIVGRQYPWAKFAGEATGKFLSVYLAQHGVTVHGGMRAQRIEGDGRVQRVLLDRGSGDSQTIDCDFLVAAVGNMANKDLLRGTPIIAEKAILVDEHCRTSEPTVFAAGDCAAVRDPLFGKHRPADQWDTAETTGILAGINMAGGNERFNTVTSFQTELFDLSARAWGECKHIDRHLLRGTPNVDAPDFVEIGVAPDGRISQMLAVGHAGEDELLEELVRRRIQVGGNEEALKDPATPLSRLI